MAVTNQRPQNRARRSPDAALNLDGALNGEARGDNYGTPQESTVKQLPRTVELPPGSGHLDPRKSNRAPIP